jgi:hypothetical protein
VEMSALRLGTGVGVAGSALAGGSARVGESTLGASGGGGPGGATEGGTGGSPWRLPEHLGPPSPAPSRPSLFYHIYSVACIRGLNSSGHVRAWSTPCCHLLWCQLAWMLVWLLAFIPLIPPQGSSWTLPLSPWQFVSRPALSLPFYFNGTAAGGANGTWATAARDVMGSEYCLPGSGGSVLNCSEIRLPEAAPSLEVLEAHLGNGSDAAGALLFEPLHPGDSAVALTIMVRV